MASKVPVTAESFSYLGRVFTPYSTADPLTFTNGAYLSDFKIPNYSHAGFYKAAEIAGAGKYNVFKMNDLLLVPCDMHLIACSQKTT